MPIEILQAGADVRNDATVTGAPAVRIGAANVRFTNGESGRVRSTDISSPAIAIDSGGATILNELGGIIRAPDYDGTAIRGSAGADRIENAGLIAGLVTLGGGADTYIEHSSYSAPVDLGGDDDLFRFDPATDSYYNQLVNGGDGNDRFVLAGHLSQADGGGVTGFEQLEIGPNVTNVVHFSGYRTIALSAGSFANLSESLNPAVDLLVPAGAYVDVGFNSSVHSVTGSDAAESVGVFNGTAIAAGVDLKGGDDQFFYSISDYAGSVSPAIGGTVNAGAGTDTLLLSIAVAKTIDLTQFTGFEYINAGTFTSATSKVRLTHVAAGLINIEGDSDPGAQLTLAETNAPNTSVWVGGPGSLTLEATTTIGTIDTRYARPLADLQRVQQGDDRFSLSVVNAGRIVGDAKLGIGDDVFDGSAGSAGGVLYGFAGNDRITGGALVDRIDGGYGADRLAGGGAADILTGGGGNDVFAGTRAELAGDTITDLAVGDRIEIADAAASGLAFVRAGTQLRLASGETLTLSSSPAARLVVNGGSGSAAATLTAVNRYTGLSDFDGNGHSDLLWRETSGAFSTWQVAGNASGNQFSVNSTFDTSVSPDWKVQETFDFDGDGRSDILWRNAASGAFTVWKGMDGGFIRNAYDDRSVATDWKIAAVGDLNGDGRDDIVWRQDGGAFSTWQSTGTGFNANVDFDTSVTPAWQIVGLGDFNGDGKDDLLWRNQTSGAFSEWWSNGTVFTRNSYFDTSVDTSWHIDGIADFNGDGRDDILWRHDGDGTFTEWQSNAGGGFAVNAYSDGSVAPVWQVNATGDYNDDGRADILWRNTQNGSFSTWQSNGTGFDPNIALVGGVGTNWQVQAHDFRFG